MKKIVASLKFGDDKTEVLQNMVTLYLNTKRDKKLITHFGTIAIQRQ